MLHIGAFLYIVTFQFKNNLKSIKTAETVHRQRFFIGFQLQTFAAAKCCAMKQQIYSSMKCRLLNHTLVDRNGYFGGKHSLVENFAFY